MMEEGDEALGFEREIYWLNGQAEIWHDRIGHAITGPAHVDRLARTIAALEDMSGGQAPGAAPSRPAIGASRACGLRSTG